MPDDHSELVPPLPIPNRTVKRLCADDSAATSVKVGHRQAVIPEPSVRSWMGGARLIHLIDRIAGKPCNINFPGRAGTMQIAWAFG